MKVSELSFPWVRTGLARGRGWHGALGGGGYLHKPCQLQAWSLRVEMWHSPCTVNVNWLKVLTLHIARLRLCACVFLCPSTSPSATWDMVTYGSHLPPIFPLAYTLETFSPTLL